MVKTVSQVNTPSGNETRSILTGNYTLLQVQGSGKFMMAYNLVIISTET
jgi:hypothetical protein